MPASSVVFFRYNVEPITKKGGTISQSYSSGKLERYTVPIAIGE